MKHLALLFVCLLIAAVPVFAQPDKEKKTENMRKELHEFKLKFLAQEMELKEDQQKKFFDLYTQMSDEKVRLYKETKALEQKLSSSANASESEYEAVSKAITAAKEKDAEIEKKYDEKFSQFLSPKQIFKMKSAEEQFRIKMHEMRHKKSGTKHKHSKK